MCFSVTQATAGFEPIIFLVDVSNTRHRSRLRVICVNPFDVSLYKRPSSNIISDDSVLLPVSHDNVSVSQHEQHQDPGTEAAT